MVILYKLEGYNGFLLSPYVIIHRKRQVYGVYDTLNTGPIVDIDRYSRCGVHLCNVVYLYYTSTGPIDLWLGCVSGHTKPFGGGANPDFSPGISRILPFYFSGDCYEKGNFKETPSYLLSLSWTIPLFAICSVHSCNTLNGHCCFEGAVPPKHSSHVYHVWWKCLKHTPLSQ